MEKYIPPTEEEIASVIAHWDEVRASVRAGKNLLTLSEMTTELTTKVAEYWDRQASIICTHQEILSVVGWNQDSVCTHCNKSVRWYSDIQLENMRELM